MKDPYLNVEALVNSVQAVQANLSTRRDILKKIFDVWEDRKEPPVAPPKPTQVRLGNFIVHIHLPYID